MSEAKPSSDTAAPAAPAAGAAPFQISPAHVGLQLAPDNLWQAINPWSFAFSGEQVGLVNISLGHTTRPDLERKILDEVGSYGKQLGHLGEAVEVLIGLIDRKALTPEQDDVLKVLEGELAEIRQLKRA